KSPQLRGLRGEFLLFGAWPCQTWDHSHSIVAGGLLDTSYTTRLIPRTSLIIRDDTLANKGCGNGAQSAVMKSNVCTARKATTYSYVRPSPMTPTDFTGRKTANACEVSSYHDSPLASSL